MKLQLLTVAAATVPLCSTLAIQDVFGDLKDLKHSLFDVQSKNPLDNAVERSPTFTPAEVLDSDTDIDQYLSINTNDVDSWIKNFFSQPISEVTNVPSDLIDLDRDISVNSIANPHHSDKTIYQLIAESKYTTILTKIINEDHELVNYLNSTDHNLTFFAPTDHAFRKIPHHHHHRDHDGGDDDDGDGDGDDHRIPKEIIRGILRYHSSPQVLNAVRLFHSHTIPSALNSTLLGTTDSHNDEDKDKIRHGLPQRLTVRAGFKGLTLNFYSHIIAADITASNGLVHALDSILLPPPPALHLLTILPTKFSTLNQALHQTSLAGHLNTTTQKSGHGFTLFAPSNTAFQRLGLSVNAFLFSPPGLPYLKALIKYHIVPGRTLYSDVLYTSGGEIKPFGLGLGLGSSQSANANNVGTHLDLPTLLGEHKIAVDLTHLGPYVSFKLNGWRRVGFADVLSKDGVIHVLDRVLIPPRRLEGDAVLLGEEGDGDDEVEIEELVERLGPWVEDDKEDGVEEELPHAGEL
ncbi:uncharacterized protein APUU_11231A [Aspergillus puulaauensis]|uniref:FAS1 domain-containing protein n=1 Tax=Aspergillus puulaauensis TaxID=1220207 RepID=A0A7R7XBX4_9EURO|nr:uncharacterized protein APUU_11231A [Aspergillus puulaauensis]BCS18403.1 hypothetical protein APUU_11231A [Aspergillus puulaauensis]